MKISYYDFLQKCQAEYTDQETTSEKKSFLKKIIENVIKKYNGNYGDIKDQVTINNDTLDSFNKMFTGSNKINIKLIPDSQEFSMYQLGILTNILSCIEEINEGLIYLNKIKEILPDINTFTESWLSLFKETKPSIFVESRDGVSYLFGPFIRESKIYFTSLDKNIIDFINDYYSNNDISDYLNISINNNPSFSEVNEYRKKFLLGDNFDNQDINLNLIYDKLKNLLLFLKCCLFIVIEFNNRTTDNESDKLSPDKLIEYKNYLILNYFKFL